MAARPPRSFERGEERRQPGRRFGHGGEHAEELVPRRPDQPDLAVEALGMAEAVGAQLVLDGAPRVADEVLEDDLVALVGGHGAVVVEQGEDRAAAAAGVRVVSVSAGHEGSVHARDPPGRTEAGAQVQNGSPAPPPARVVTWTRSCSG